MKLRVGALGLVLCLLVVACGGGVTVTAVEEVGAAFSETAQATSYRVTQSTAQTIFSTALGLDTQAEIDPDRPTMVGEVGPNSSHLEFDLAALLGPALGDIGPLSMEMWIDADRLVIDTRSYQTILDINPGTDLGPFEPGVSFVDLAAIGADSPEVVAAIAGSGAPDLALLAERLPAVLEDVERSDDDPRGPWRRALPSTWP